jgi:hypothetical protein
MRRLSAEVINEVVHRRALGESIRSIARSGSDRLKVTHPDRLKVTHLVLEDGRSGQERS